MPLPTVSVAIPTYGRESVLVDTVQALLAEPEAVLEILIVDQTTEHEAETTRRLAAWNESGAIRWIRLPRPSIPRAMNTALLEARGDVVLFLDDDIQPAPGLVVAHARAHRPGVAAVVGQILQPGQGPQDLARDRRDGLRRDLGFAFNGRKRVDDLANCMAGNLSVDRRAALQAGGFDENFVGAAYRFETEFCRRLAGSGLRTAFEPEASIRHLRAPHGGTRSFGSHLTSARGDHGVGDYYFALRTGSPGECLAYSVRRIAGELASRFYLARPWWIPVRLVGELRAAAWAFRLHRAGPSHVSWPPTKSGGS